MTSKHSSKTHNTAFSEVTLDDGRTGKGSKVSDNLGLSEVSDRDVYIAEQRAIQDANSKPKRG
jgi:hypothetical protein